MCMETSSTNLFSWNTLHACGKEDYVPSDWGELLRTGGQGRPEKLADEIPEQK